MQSGLTMFRQTLLFLLFLSPIPLAAQQTAPSPNPCDEQPPSQRQMDACAGFQYRQADARLNKVYQKAMEYMTNDQSRAEKNNDQHRCSMKRLPSKTSTSLNGRGLVTATSNAKRRASSMKAAA